MVSGVLIGAKYSSTVKGSVNSPSIFTFLKFTVVLLGELHMGGVLTLTALCMYSPGL